LLDLARLAFAMGDSSHVDDEQDGGENFRKGNKSSDTWPRHADENEFGVRPAAADCTAPRKACLATLTLRQRERLAAHCDCQLLISLSLNFGSFPSWLSLNPSASSPSPPSSSYHHSIGAPSPPPFPHIPLPERRRTWHMQPLSRHPPASLARNKKLDTALSLSLNDPSDPSLTTDTTVHIHRAPLAQIDQQNVAPTPAEHSPLSRVPPETIPPTRALGKPMPRRSSYTGEDGHYTASTSSQSPPYRRLSQYVSLFFSTRIVLPPSLPLPI
jgi:hypothetical protein